VKRVAVTVLQVLGYLLLFLTVTVAVMGLTKALVGDWETGGAALETAGEGLLTSLGIALTGLLLLGRSRSSPVFRGWPGLRAGLTGFGRGGVAGFLLAGSMLLSTVALGGARIELEPGAVRAYVRYVVPLGGGLLVAALAEEWLFRGYPLTRLAGVLGRGWASLTMSVLFAAAHLGAAGSNALVSVNIVLGSLVVGALRFTPGGIAAAWGFHFVWNFTQVLGGATLSLEKVDVPGVTFVATGSTARSGGAFGPEAGIGATIVTVLALAVLVVHFRRQGVRDLPIPFGRPRAWPEEASSPPQ
jgi:membrane protease YdiL (CAAX protease family)